MKWLNKYSNTISKAQNGKIIDYTSLKEAENKVQLDTQKAKEFYENWQNSPQYLKMLNDSSQKNEFEEISNRRNNNLSKVKTTFKNINRNSVAGASNKTSSSIDVFPIGVNMNTLVPHEMSHVTDRPKIGTSKRAIPKKDIEKINSFSNLTPIEYNNLASRYEKKENTDEWVNYVSEPTETRARLNQIRMSAKSNNLYDPFIQEVSPEIYNNLKNYNFESEDLKAYEPLKQLQDIYSDEEIRNMLNTVSDNNSNTEIQSMQKGGSIKNPIYVNNKNDPRYRAYQDSLTVYNDGIIANKKIKPFLGMYSKPSVIDDDNKSKKLWMSSLGKKNGKTNHVLEDAGITIEQSYKKRIAPISSNLYNSDAYNLTIQNYKKPQQPIIVKQNITEDLQRKNLTYKNQEEIKSYLYEKPREKISQIQNYITPQGIYTEEQSFNTELPQIRQVTQQPKYYDVTDKVNQNFGGSETNYKWYPQDGNLLQELSQEKYEDGTPYNQRTMIPRFQTGGIIEDNMGQWSYPGQVTRINSPNITMKNVKQRLLGISDTGDMQLMYPEQEYKFKGKNVTEFPVANNGISVNSNWLDNY